MKSKVWGVTTGLLLLALLGARSLSASEVSPLTISLFADYGTPVQPLGLSQNTIDTIGGEFLAEWNPASMASIGLGFETQAFYANPTFSLSTLNLEGRLFPWDNGRQKFSPYLFGGTGLNLSSYGGPIQLKAGLGSRVSLAGPVFLDVAVGSHWLTDPNSLQYVDARAGLSVFIDFKPQATPTPTPVPATPTPTVGSPIPTPTAMPKPTATIGPEQVISLDEGVPTPTPVIDSKPVKTLAESKKFYKIGMDAFLAGNYPLALKALKKSLSLKEKHKHPYKYAETYATIGVIWQFHASKVKDHEKRALENYRAALKIDRRTKSARHYYPGLKAKLDKEARAAKKKAKPKSVPTAESTSKSEPKPVPTVKVVPTPTVSINVNVDLR